MLNIEIMLCLAGFSLGKFSFMSNYAELLNTLEVPRLSSLSEEFVRFKNLLSSEGYIRRIFKS